MTIPTSQTDGLNAAVQEFEHNGFVVIPNALSAAQLVRLNTAFDRYVTDFPEEWAHFSESFINTADVLPRTADFDEVIENPVILPLMQQLLGEKMAFEELGLMIRNPTDNTGELKGWHRDIIRDYDRRFEINAISVVYYLTDVTERDHCFSIIPGTHNRLVDMRPADVTPGMEVDAHGPAGSAFVFHARCIHAGKLRVGSTQRRTLHLYYERYGEPRTNQWTQIPPRLYLKDDPALPPYLYAKAAVRATLDGVGRKPRDVPPDMTTAQMLIHVQQRANKRATAP